MIRTLFLLAILATLLVIVIKKPDQTFWDAAQGLWRKIEGTASEVTEAPPALPLTGNVREDYAALLKRVRRALEIAEGSGATVDREPLAARSKGGTDRDGPANPALSSPSLSSKNKPSTIGNIETSASSSSSSGEDTLPAPRVTDMPELPAIPVAPVEVVEIGKSVTPPSRSRPRPADSRNLGEVKAYYENASRLLAEIQ